MKLGEVGNRDALRYGKPLDGIRVLALEQMQSLPVATQLMARLGAQVVKVEPPSGESGRAAQPAAVDEKGQTIGATFLRYNLGKRSIAVDLKSDEGRDLVLALIPHFDVVCENLGPGRADRLGVGYEAASHAHAAVVYLSISGFGNDGSPYTSWPAYAGVAEAMSGIYEYARRPHQPPVINPVGGLGDTGPGLFGLIGVLCALRHRDRTGLGEYVDISMFDAMLSICDVATNFWSLGLRREPDEEIRGPYILDGFRAKDGWFFMQIARDHQFERLANLIGHPEWLGDKRFANRWGWSEHLEDTIRPAVESWAAVHTKHEVTAIFAEAGITAAPCNTADEVIHDPHVSGRRMLVEVPRSDSDEPVLVPGNPVKLSRVAEGPEEGYPTVGEHTDSILAEFLGFDDDRIALLRARGVVA
jgi:crotonobetainyl-CoA:carnitine CoA-transferase CaiB-like acyl-CoA transferase